MATQAQVKSFIEILSALAKDEMNKRDRWVLPSICVAQAALETGWGTSSLMTKANAFFGIKATASWGGKVYNSATKECYDGANYTDITACFRAYDSLAESVADYYNLICNNDRYAGAVNNSDANSTITAIKNGGYATSPDYITNVMSIVNKHNLTQYDSKTEIVQAASVGFTNFIADANKNKVWLRDGAGPECKELRFFNVGDGVEVIGTSPADSEGGRLWYRVKTRNYRNTEDLYGYMDPDDLNR